MTTYRKKHGPPRGGESEKGPRKGGQTIGGVTHVKVLGPFEPEGQPGWISTEIKSNGDTEHAHGAGIVSLRETQHRGRHIRVKTTYEITVNGVPFTGHVVITNDGRIYSHACPYRDFSSAVDMIKHLIELYPESFTRQGVSKESPARSHEHPGGQG